MQSDSETAINEFTRLPSRLNLVDKIEVWKVDPASSEVESLKPINRVEAEESLEEMLAKNPELIDSGLTLIGRQMTIDTNYALDLLGIDQDGKLVVFELKRGAITRRAVAQVIDYCSWIDELGEEELLRFIIDNSGGDAIEKIEDIETWYSEQHSQPFEEASLKPTKMVLIGLGVDDRTKRIIDYLADKEVNISLVTYHGYEDENSRFLARVVESDFDNTRTQLLGNTREMLTQKLATSRREYKIDDEFWSDVIDSLSPYAGSMFPKKYGMTFNQKDIRINDVNYNALYSVNLEETGRLTVAFNPISIFLCSKLFDDLKDKFPFKSRPVPNAPSIDQFDQQWYCSFDESEWKNSKDALVSFTQSIRDHWNGGNLSDSNADNEGQGIL